MLLQSPNRCHAAPAAAKRNGPRPRTTCRVWPFSGSKAKRSQPDPPQPEDAQQQYQQQQQAAAGLQEPSQPELLRTSPKWRWLDSGAPPQPQSTRRRLTQTQAQQQQQQQQDQLTAQQQAALRDMIMDATVNPKWRWPSFGNNDSAFQQPPPQQGDRNAGSWPTTPPPPPTGSWPPFTQQQQAQQGQSRGGFWGRSSRNRTGPPPPPPPPPPQGYVQQGYTEGPPQQQPRPGRWQEGQRRRGGWWPFGDGLSEEDEAYRDQLEAMGVDLVGSKAREQQQRRQQGDGDVDFDRMDDRQIAAYVNEVRQNRLERVANKQDDEVVGIVGLYLSITMVILALAALANLPV